MSFWQFAKDASRREKAEMNTAGAIEDLGAVMNLDEGDYIIGWNELPSVYRYCHSFTDAEIEALTNSLGSSAKVVDCFVPSEGPDKTNAYVIMRKTGNVSEGHSV